MFVCICHNVTDKELRAMVQQGKGSLRDIKKEIEIARQCGKCIRLANQVITEEMEKLEANYYQVA